MNVDIKSLEARALWARRKVLEMAVRTGSGHVSTAMSQMEILVALYFGDILRYDPKNPNWEGRDFFILSKGQGGIGLYPILAAAGYFPEPDLDNFTGEGSSLGVHSEWHTPGVEVLTGSLGHGLPIATGIAQALKNDGKDNLVFCMVGDGELHEGSNWEAILNASWRRLDNLVIIIDRNEHCTLGKTDGNLSRDGVGLEPLGDKIEAFGVDSYSVDGHNLDRLLNVFSVVREDRCGRPKCVITETQKGHGLSCMEDKRMWHYRVPSGLDLKDAWRDLGVTDSSVQPPSIPSQAKHAVGMRDRFFNALFEHFKKDKNLVLLAADNGAPSMDQFTELVGQFYQVGIAEQQMLGMAAGLAKMGKRPYCYAIAPFVTTRVHEFVKLDLCAMNLPICLIGVGAGYAYDIMGPSHHTVEDIAIMRTLPNLTIWSPADGVTAATIADETVKMAGPSYVRLDRGGLGDIYSGDCGDASCGMAWAKSFGNNWGVILATGVMVHQALKVAEEIGEVGVGDICCLKPFPHDLLLPALARTASRVITLEEHQLNGGLGSIVAETFADHEIKVPLLRIGVPDSFTFDMGGREVIWQKYGLDVNSIARRIREWYGS